LSPSPRSAVAGRADDVAGQLLGLKLRTLLAAAVMLVLAVAAARLLRGPVDELLSRVAAGGGLPAHMPADGFPGGASALASAVLAVALAGALGGLSWGAFGQLSIRWVMAPVLLPGLLLAVLAPRETQWLGLNSIEQAIQRGHASVLPGLLAGRQPVLRDYGLAQLALRTNDAEALRTHGMAVLQAADKLAHGLAPADAHGAAQMQPAVVHSIDVALHGEPVSEAGIAWQQRPGWWARSDGWRMLGRTLGGAAVLAAAFAAMRVWDLMRRRVRLIVLESGVAANRPARPAPRSQKPDALQKPQPPQVPPQPPPLTPQPPPPPIEWGWILRAVVVCAVPVLLLRLFALGLERL
jgi:hypothetical protein